MSDVVAHDGMGTPREMTFYEPNPDIRPTGEEGGEFIDTPQPRPHPPDDETDGETDNDDDAEQDG
jgi:hypothetical protein